MSVSHEALAYRVSVTYTHPRYPGIPEANRFGSKPCMLALVCPE